MLTFNQESNKTMPVKPRYQVRVYFWNPNGTNDIEVLCNGIVVESIPEALFGYNIDRNTKLISIKSAMKFVAVSPVSDGMTTIKVLRKYL